jgi:hypothetical protein
VGKLASLADVLLHYRLHTGSICHTREKDQEDIRPALEAEVYQRRGLTLPHRNGNGIVHRSLEDPGARFKLWGWWALSGGNVPTARRYAIRALRSSPLTAETWRLMFCAFRGR